MPDERGSVTNTSGEELFTDEALGLNGAGSDPQAGVQSSPNSDKDVQEPPDFGGLPFKSVEDFVKGHKSLQDEYRRSREDLFKMQEYLRAIAPMLERLNQAPQAGPKEEEPDIPKFLEDFIQSGPKAVEGIAGKHFDQRWKAFEKEQLTPLQERLDKLERKEQIDLFMQENPSLNSDDEDALLDVIRTTPWLRNMNASAYEKLEAALGQLLKKEPTRFSSRKDGERQAVNQGWSSMKTAASSVGPKAGSRPKEPKDEFDEVLDLDARTWKRL